MSEMGILGYHETPMRVRFGEVDQYRVLWHGHVLAYFEVARADLVRQFHLSVTDLDELGFTVPILELQVQYKHRAHHDELLSIQSSLVKPPMRSPFLEYVYVIVNGKGTEIVHGRTRQIVMQRNGELVTRLPDALDARIREIWSYLAKRPRWSSEQTAHLTALARSSV